MIAVAELIPSVVQAVSGEDYIVYAYLNDGTIRRKDMAPVVLGALPGSVFAKIADKNIFYNTLTVMNETVAWDINGDRNPRKCIDIDPYSVYEWEIVKDPLENEK